VRGKEKEGRGGEFHAKAQRKKRRKEEKKRRILFELAKKAENKPR
jgi:hypothetical protein